jgi:hypothetical protein
VILFTHFLCTKACRLKCWSTCFDVYNCLMGLCFKCCWWFMPWLLFFKRTVFRTFTSKQTIKHWCHLLVKWGKDRCKYWNSTSPIDLMHYAEKVCRRKINQLYTHYLFLKKFMNIWSVHVLGLTNMHFIWILKAFELQTQSVCGRGYNV